MSLLTHLRKVPWKHVKRTLDWIRRLRPVDWSDEAPLLDLDLSHAELEARLREHYWEGTPYTLYYRGEVVNLRRPTGVRDSDDFGGTDYYSEDHIRTRDHPENEALIQVCAHNEWSRYEEKTGHVHKKDIEWLGETELKQLLENCGIGTERVEAR